MEEIREYSAGNEQEEISILKLEVLMVNTERENSPGFVMALKHVLRFNPLLLERMKEIGSEEEWMGVQSQYADMIGAINAELGSNLLRIIKSKE